MKKIFILSLLFICFLFINKKAEAKIWTKDLVDKVTLNSGYKFSLCSIDMKYDHTGQADNILSAQEKDFEMHPEKYPCNEQFRENILFADITMYFSKINWGGEAGADKLIEFQNKLYSIGGYTVAYSPGFVGTKYDDLAAFNWFSDMPGINAIRWRELSNTDPEGNGELLSNSEVFILHNSITGKFEAAIFVLNGITYKLADIIRQVTVPTTLVDYTQTSLESPETSSPSASAQVATPTPDPTADWKTYVNTSFNFTIKYPQSWVGVQDWADSSSLAFHVNNGSQLPSVGIDINKTDWLNSSISSYREVIVAGVTARKRIWESGVNSHPGEQLEFKKNSYHYIVDLHYDINQAKKYYPSDLDVNVSAVKVFDQILSTFKFTDKNQKKVSVPTPTAAIEVIPRVESAGLFSGKYCNFDYRNYLSKKNDAEVFFNFCEKNIPKIASELGVNLNGRKTTLTFSETGFAGTSGDTISFLSSWNPNEPGFLLHEGTHFVQNYGNKAENRGWVTEGLADLVRFKLTKTSDEPGWAIGCENNQTYTFGYGCAAAFFLWMGNYCGNSNIQVVLNNMILDGSDTNIILNNLCGKDIDGLWNIYKTTNPPERIYPQT